MTYNAVIIIRQASHNAIIMLHAGLDTKDFPCLSDEKSPKRYLLKKRM